jgi:hypothetical protein
MTRLGRNRGRAVLVGCVSFPLTLALSLWEREQACCVFLGSDVTPSGTVRSAIQRRDTRTTQRVRFATKRRAILLLPKGEGWGEGNSSPLESNLELAALATVRTSAFDRLWDRWMANFDCERRSSCVCNIPPAVLVGCVSFPLTLALSPREREHLLPGCSESRRSGPAKARRAILPLPKGEGWGEGNLSRFESSPG